MTTGQAPRRRETDVQAQRRAESLNTVENIMKRRDEATMERVVNKVMPTDELRKLIEER